MIIARYEAPKQRLTVHYGYVLIEDAGVDKPHRFHVCQVNLDTGATINSGSMWELDERGAWRVFHKMIEKNAAYGPDTWERS